MTSRKSRTRREETFGKQTFLIVRIAQGSVENAKISNGLSKGKEIHNHRSQMGK